MKTTEYLIEKCLDLSISEDERAILKERMCASNALVKEYAFRKELNGLHVEIEVNELRMKLRKASAIHEHLSAERYMGHSTKRLIYAAAAVTGITLGGWALFSGDGSRVSTETLYNEFFSPYPPVVIYRDASSVDVYKEFQAAMLKYQKANYEEAARILERIYQQVPDSVTIKFYLGVTYMQLGQFEDSRILFNQVISSDILFSELAIWYKGLSYLAENNREEALETLKHLEKNKTPIGTNASKLIEILSSK